MIIWFTVGRTKRKRTNKTYNRGNLANGKVVVALSRWMKANGWKNTFNLSLRDFECTGRGVFSSKNIKEYATLIEIPYNLMITYGTIQKSEILNTLTFNPNQNWYFHDFLALFLMFEKHKDHKSIWKFYIDSLPQEIPPLPFTFSHGEMELLPDTVKDLALSLRGKFEESWSRIQRSIVSSWKCDCCKKEADRVFTFDSYRWGYAMVNTRAVYVDPQIVQELSEISNNNFRSMFSDQPCMALCPYLDMFNHSCDSKTEAALIKNGSAFVYELKTLTPYKKYEQIFISYGSHDNVKLLCEYGFFLTVNKLDRIRFNFEEVLEVLNIKLASKQYKLIMDKNFKSDLYINYLGLSFNLKSVLCAAFEDDICNCKMYIFSENYPQDVFRQMSEWGKILLKRKMEYNVEWLTKFEVDACKFTLSFCKVIEYIKYENDLIGELSKILENMITTV